MKKDYTYLPEVVVDTHCHGRDLEQSYKTTIYQTLLEAYLSGINITFFQPNTNPPIIDIPTLKLCIKKAREAERKLGLRHRQRFFFGLTDFNLDECNKALQYDEVVGLKKYPISQKGKTVTTGTIGVMYKKTKLAGMKLVRKYGKVLDEHCGNPAINAIDGGDSIRSEVADVAESIELAEKVPGVKITICHVSCIQSAEMILTAQRKGLQIAIEVCPHYLMFSGDGYNWNPKLHPVFYWCYNNLRGRKHIDYLRLLLSTSYDNRLVFLGSDNASHTRDEKLESAEKGKWIGGLPSNRHFLPTIITLAKLHSWSHEHVARLVSWNAADYYGIEVPRGLKKCDVELKKGNSTYNNGVIENPWSHLKLWYPAEKG